MDTAQPFFTTGSMGRIATAIAFDLAKFAFSIILLLLPLLAGLALGSLAEQKCNNVLPDWVLGKGWVCHATNTIVATTVTVGGYALEFGSGVGDVAVATVGEVFDDAIDIMAWVIFAIWFLFAGIKFSGTKRSTSKLLAASGSAVAGVVPFVNFFPTITIGVVMVEWNHWKDMQEKAVKNASIQSRADKLSMQRANLNAVYVRQQAAVQSARQQQYDAQRVAEIQTYQRAAQRRQVVEGSGGWASDNNTGNFGDTDTTVNGITQPVSDEQSRERLATLRRMHTSEERYRYIRAMTPPQRKALYIYDNGGTVLTPQERQLIDSMDESKRYRPAT